ncbi:hypothetical protein DM390_22245 [Shigella flexneri]|nr:hypothetical protein [Shigella flexneri]EFY0034680.1 hypothetical protein [Shigella flexneri]EGA6925956.1 hypothetical protein [Shigella flexneri]EGA7034455.1 hypothetical protein [Shigella flexneri]EGD7983703.1 hypothetical protein [Shigella flexneri]
MTIGLGAYSAHETHFRTFSVRESLTHCYISEQTPLAAPPGASCKKTHRAASSPPLKSGVGAATTPRRHRFFKYHKESKKN